MDKNQIITIAQNLQPLSAHKEQLCEKLSKVTPRISTGWKSVDIALQGGLTNELYVVAAETSTGKSALMLNMAASIAADGGLVLYYSLEMSELEHLARLIARESKCESVNPDKRSYTASDILNWKYEPSIDDFCKIPHEAYSEYMNTVLEGCGDRLYFIEGGINGLSAKDIANISSNFKESHPGEQIVIFVDYLQLCRADTDDRSQIDRKNKIDEAVKTLKVLASQVGMPVITASSVSRCKYGEKISTSSFKESGDTEYTGGILIGWNWLGVTDEKNDERANEERKQCKNQGFRRMSFEVLKNRNAQRDTSAELIYFAAYNLIIDEYQWHPDVNGEYPFIKRPDNVEVKVISN